MSHHFATILAADIAQFSGLMERDAEGTVQALQDIRILFQNCVATHHGREFGSVGDSLMAEFPGPVEALRAARDIHASLDARKPVNRRGELVQLRIGLHAGDVICDGENVFGDVVNTASRLQQIAKPGGIALSGLVHEQVRKETGFLFRPLGRQMLKNIGGGSAIHIFVLLESPWNAVTSAT